jgi:hypothetical protein
VEISAHRSKFRHLETVQVARTAFSFAENKHNHVSMFWHRHSTENSEEGISTKIVGVYKNLKYTLVTGDFLRNTKEELLIGNLRIKISCK